MRFIAKRLVARKVVFEHGVLCYAGLQLESAKRLVTAARKVVFEHGVIVVLCRIAAGECKTPCNSCEKGSF